MDPGRGEKWANFILAGGGDNIEEVVDDGGGIGWMDDL